MRHRLLALALVTAAAAPAMADQHPAVAIVARVEAAPDDPDVAAKALRDLDVLAVRNPADGAVPYARGLVLAKIGRSADAIVAYDAAFALDRTLAAAPYNAGVVLLNLRRYDDSIKHLEAALAADPTLVDAAYNLGQAHYDRKEFALALASWQRARKLAPDDFGAAKKILQALNALGRSRDATAARDDVLALWRTSTDEAVRRLTEYVFDQFDVAGWHVYAYETLMPAPDGTIYRFELADPGDHARGSIHVDARPGKPYLMVMVDDDQATQPLATKWKTLPTYAVVKTAITRAIKQRRGKYTGPAGR